MVRPIFDRTHPGHRSNGARACDGLEDAARRRFLITGLVIALAPQAGICADSVEERALRFSHTHTGETLSVVYFRGGRYIPESFERVKHLLRDFRTNEEHAIDPALLDILFQLQLEAHQDGPFEVISGYRSPQTNAALRSRSSAVAEHSLHMQGRAIDIRLRGFPTAKLRDIAIALQRGGVGFYPVSDFVHVDTGRVRKW